MGKLTDIRLGLKNIQAEAQSKDPWTSRARLTFKKVMILAAISENMRWTFGIGYTGYVP